MSTLLNCYRSQRSDFDKERTKKIKAIFKYCEPIFLFYAAIDVLKQRTNIKPRNLFYEFLDSEFYHVCGTTRTLLGHCVFLEENENETDKTRERLFKIASNLYKLYKRYGVDLTKDDKSLFFKAFKDECNMEKFFFKKGYFDLETTEFTEKDDIEISKAVTEKVIRDENWPIKDYLSVYFGRLVYDLVATRDGRWEKAC